MFSVARRSVDRDQSYEERSLACGGSPEAFIVGIASNRRELGVPTLCSIDGDTGIKISGRRINGCSLSDEEPGASH